jgi:hypothetical protein
VAHIPGALFFHIDGIVHRTTDVRNVSEYICKVHESEFHRLCSHSLDSHIDHSIFRFCFFLERHFCICVLHVFVFSYHTCCHLKRLLLQQFPHLASEIRIELLVMMMERDSSVCLVFDSQHNVWIHFTKMMKLTELGIAIELFMYKHIMWLISFYEKLIFGCLLLMSVRKSGNPSIYYHVQP